MKPPLLSDYAQQLLARQEVPRRTLTIQLPATSPALLSVSDVCRCTGFSRDHVYRLVRVGWIASTRPTPKKLRIFRVSLDQHLLDVAAPDFWTRERRLDWASSFSG